jgi:hypothetical protein
MIHRVATAKRYSSSLIEIQTLWTLDDVMDAIEVLDMYDQLDSAANADPNEEIVS